jgi:hypothetical protein
MASICPGIASNAKAENASAASIRTPSRINAAT